MSSRKWHMIDYTLIDKEFRSSVEDVSVHRTTADRIGTDHHQLRINLKFHLKRRTKAKITQPLRVER